MSLFFSKVVEPEQELKKSCLTSIVGSVSGGGGCGGGGGGSSISAKVVVLTAKARMGRTDREEEPFTQPTENKRF